VKALFLTVEEAVARYSVDACRLTLADAGDSMEDSNFEYGTANRAIMELSRQEKNFEDYLTGIKKGSYRSNSNYTFQDRVFMNEINCLMEEARKAFQNMFFREANLATFSRLLNARNKYRQECEATSVEMHADALVKFANAFVLSNSPFCPFWAERMWQKYPEIRMGSTSKFVVKALWPEGGKVNHTLRREDQFCQDVLKDFKRLVKSGMKRKKGKQQSDATVQVFVQETYSEAQVAVLDFLKNVYQQNPESLNPKQVTKPLRAHLQAIGLAKKEIGMALGFGSSVLKRELPANGPAALESKCPFDQVTTLTVNNAYMARSLKIKAMEIYVIGQEGCPDSKKEIATSKPGNPSMKLLI
jgi:leucyl-tRNA synthetase